MLHFLSNPNSILRESEFDANVSRTYLKIDL
jgi:hypothetical protein